MRERPILFSAPMVRALIAGTKTQTRRVVKPQPPEDRMHTSVDSPDRFVCPGEHTWWAGNHTQGIYHSARCPYGQPGDRLWVRETWAPNEGTAGGYLYRADHSGASALEQHDLKTGACTHRVSKWRPSIHIPRAASRILLEVDQVRVERLHDISEVDSIAEGLTQTAAGSWLPGPCDHPEWAYHQLWEQINGARSWDANPWVWALSFRVLGMK